MTLHHNQEIGTIQSTVIRRQNALKRKVRRTLGKLQRAFETRGLLGTLRLAGISLWNGLERLTGNPTTPAIDAFDRQYGVETATKVPLSDLDINSRNYAYGIEYSAVAIRLFNEAMNRLDIVHSRFRFVDMGSGKGRVLLLAAAFPFREIVGVEFSPDLHQAALENISKYSGPRNCGVIRSVCMDAVEFPLPEDPLVVFFYHPFVGKTMLRVLLNMEASLRSSPREFYAVYLNPVMAAEFAACRSLTEIFRAPEYRIYCGVC
jgi:SAM-dependent methyltransferase